MEVLTVFGTRAEAIKLAPVIRELQRQSADHRVEARVCVTAQHRQMLEQVIHLFEITRGYDLEVMKDNQTPTQVAATALSRLEPILREERPSTLIYEGAQLTDW